MHELDRGMGASALAVVGFGIPGWLFVRGVDPAAGFGAAMLRAIPFAFLSFVLCIAGVLAGRVLSRPHLWGTRPLNAWEQHPDVERYRSEGWLVWYFDPASGSID